MKKIISMFLIALIVFSLCACGNNSKNGGKSIELRLGEKIETDIIEFSLDRFEFADKLFYKSYDSMTGPDAAYMLPTKENIPYNPYVADNGKTLASFSYSLKYNGTEDFDFSVVLNTKLLYNNDYSFEPNAVIYLFGDHYCKNKASGDADFNAADCTLHPLDAMGEGRGFFKIPSQVQNDEDGSIRIVFSIPNKNGSVANATYVIR